MNNQITIASQVNKLNSRIDNWFLTTVAVLSLENISRLVINNCFMIIELINELENAIMSSFTHCLYECD